MRRELSNNRLQRTRRKRRAAEPERWTERRELEGVVVKRDMELVRRILLATEEAGDSPFDAGQLVEDGVDEATIVYHVDLLNEAGLLEAKVTRYISGDAAAKINRLTWAGHDYLDAVRDDTVWNRTRSRIGETIGTASLEVVKAMAVAVSKEMLGLR